MESKKLCSSHFGAKKFLWRLDLGKTYFKYLDLVRSEFLSFVAPPNESLRIIIKYYMFKYTFGIRTTLLESLRSQKSLLWFNCGKTTYNGFVLTRNVFLTLFGGPNNFLGLIIIHYMFKYSFRIKRISLDTLRSQISPLKARFRLNWL